MEVVAWPSEQKQSFENVPADKFYLIRKDVEKMELQPIEKSAPASRTF
jgi:hypothetical protein